MSHNFQTLFSFFIILKPFKQLMDKMYPRLDVRKFFSFDGYGLKLDKVA
jgi:hypothetical protein